MLSDLAISGPVAWVLLAVPVVVLVIAAVSSFRVRAVRGVAVEGTPGLEGKSPAGQGVLGLTGQAESTPREESERQDFDQPTSGLIAFPFGSGDGMRAAKLDERAAARAAREIASLELGKTTDERLGALYLQVGEHLCANGSRSEGGEFIRKCIGFAISRKDDRLQAQARMALGELAVGDGDLGGACEQWQMARELLTGSGASELGNKVSAHMHRCGCPTEWVLTDF